jgi:hypothetical protein
MSALPTEFKQSEKPLMIYVSSDEPDAAKRTAQVEENVFADENVAIGARVFRSVRIKGDKISKEHPHWRTLGGKELPRMVIVDTSGKKVGSVEGNDFSASNLFKHMKKAASRTFKTDLDKIVKEGRSLLDDMDQVIAKQNLIAEKKKKLGADAAKDKEIEAEESKLATQLKELQTREAELMKKVETDRKVGKA